MPGLTPEESRARFAGARVARLATAGADGQPHLVAIVFAATGDRIVHGVDHKPKSTMALKRLANIAANPRVSMLVDHYSERWEDLWWVRADGLARVLEDAGERAAALARLVERYPQYGEQPPAGPVIEVQVTRWSGWSYSDLGIRGSGPC
ncbi:MAG: TIGR03668 family PPOX class F420-dependent oxidoreductase [Candidatus Dormibacteraeota bacterium]|nr:TIGR03668 family PPOX class F420-dependent oxidoreductase [Candidatus Dormibacteraeota bacterium]